MSDLPWSNVHAWVVLILVAGTSGCGTDPASPDDASTDGTTDTSASDDGSTSDAADAKAEARVYPTYNIVDGGGLTDGDASVCIPDKYETRSCCNDTPCSGFCEGLPDGAVQCSCFGVASGCDPGQVCCNAFRGCTADFNCGLPQK